MKPDFIHVGPGRSGTTYLYKMLETHPAIGLPKNIKETNFFNLNYSKGISWYNRFFEFDGKRIQGEICPNYFYFPLAFERIRLHLPQVKVITILRNPYQRMISSYSYLIRSGRIPSRQGFEETFCLDGEYFSQNIYAPAIQKLMALFPRDQIYIDLYDHLEQNYQSFLFSLLDFLGVDSQGWNPKDRRVNQSRVVQNAFLLFLGRRLADELRRWELFAILERLKSSTFVNDLIYKKQVRQPESFPSRFSEPMISRLDSDIRQLEILLGLDLSHWRP